MKNTLQKSDWDANYNCPDTPFQIVDKIVQRQIEIKC